MGTLDGCGCGYGCRLRWFNANVATCHSLQSLVIYDTLNFFSMFQCCEFSNFLAGSMRTIAWLVLYLRACLVGCAGTSQSAKG